MALFGFGKNKNKPPKTTPRYDGEPQLDVDTPQKDLNIIYSEILSKNIGADLDGVGLVFPDVGIHLTAQVQRINGGANGMYSAEMLFILTHDYFDEPLCEYTAGIGETEEQAMRNGTTQFCQVVLMSVIAVFGCTGEHVVESDIVGEKHEFRFSCTRAILSMGAQNPDSQDMWELIESEMPKYLGRKKAYWVKLFACRVNDRSDCEVRINGALFPDLTKRLVEYTETWTEKQAFHSEKEFVLLIRQDDIPDDGLESSEIIGIAAKVCPMLTEIKDEDSDFEVMAKIMAMCGEDMSLMWNMRNFIPEICASMITGLKLSDGCTINRGDKDSISVMYSQIKSFGYIEQGVMKYLNETSPPRENVLGVAGLSAVLGIAGQIMEKGGDISSFEGSVGMTYNAFEGYEIR